MSSSLINFLCAVSNYYISWILPSLIVYITILAVFTLKVIFYQRNKKYIVQDIFGAICSLLFCIFLAIIQGIFLGSVIYFTNNNTEIPLLKKIFFNTSLPAILMGFEFLLKSLSRK